MDVHASPGELPVYLRGVVGRQRVQIGDQCRMQWGSNRIFFLEIFALSFFEI